MLNANLVFIFSSWIFLKGCITQQFLLCQSVYMKNVQAGHKQMKQIIQTFSAYICADIAKV